MIIPSKRKLAAHFGVSRPAVDKWIKAGLPHKTPAPGKFQFDSIEVEAWRDQRKKRRAALRDGVQANKKVEDQVQYESLRYRKAKADRAELDLAVLRGKLIERETAESRLIQTVMVLRQSLQGMGARLAPRLQHQRPGQIKKLLDDEIEQIFGDITASFKLPKKAETLLRHLYAEADRIIHDLYPEANLPDGSSKRTKKRKKAA